VLGSEVSGIIPKLPLGYSVFHLADVGDAASCAKSGQSVPQGYYNIETMLKAVARGGCTLGVFSTCMDARGLKDPDLVEGTRRSFLNEMTEWTLWAEKVLVF